MNLFGKVVIDVIAFSLFGFIHSWLASYEFKEKAAARIGKYMAFYRLVYNLIALYLLWLMFEYLPRPDLELYDMPAPFDFIIVFIQILWLIGIIWTFRYFSLQEFLGISQIVRFNKNEYNPEYLDEKLTLKVKGPYRVMRHPLYFFTILFLIFRPTMDLFYLVFLTFVIIYFFIGSYYEEKKLIRVFGNEYLTYKKAVPAIIPYKLLSPYKEEVSR